MSYIDPDKLMWLFKQVHGEITGRCSAKVVYDDEMNAIGVSVMKDGNTCWTATKEDLMFDYITRNAE
jgi:hypothetical protein